MTTAAPDFKILWDNAYAFHHLTEAEAKSADILSLASAAGHPHRPIMFASTSKITYAGAGVAFLGGSVETVKWYTGHLGKGAIGPDKVNQLRHSQFFGSPQGVRDHMQKHRQIIAPKFEPMLGVLHEQLDGLGIASWTEPTGGYFISLDVLDGTAARVIELAKQAGRRADAGGLVVPLRRRPERPQHPAGAHLPAAGRGRGRHARGGDLRAAGRRGEAGWLTPRSLRELPKAHLHLHFTGSMRHATLLELAERDGIRLPDQLVSQWPPELSAADEKGWFRFQRLYDVARSVLRTEGDVRRLVLEAAEDDVHDGGGWLEIQVDPSGYAARFGGITAFTDLVLDAVRSASEQTGLAMARRHRRQPHPAPAGRAHPGQARRPVRRPRRGRLRPVQRRATRLDRRLRGRVPDRRAGRPEAGPARGRAARPRAHRHLPRRAARPAARSRRPIRRGPAAAGPDRRRAASRSRSARSATSRWASTPT